MSPRPKKQIVERRSQTPIKVLLGALVLSIAYLLHVQVASARSADRTTRELRGLWMQIDNGVYVHKSMCGPHS